MEAQRAIAEELDGDDMLDADLTTADSDHDHAEPERPLEPRWRRLCELATD